MHAQSHTSLRWYCRGIGLVFAVAFASWAVQVVGLVGEHGIAPAAPWLPQVAPWSVYGRGASDTWLVAVSWIGCGFGLAAALGWIQAPAIALCVWLYASTIVAGQEFMSFQWDVLLIECGIAAFVICPWAIRDRKAWLTHQPGASVWVLRWLLWRLMFQSGFVKLATGDTTWRDLTALQFHFETQPLPGPFSWYANALPDVLLRFGTAATLGIELVLSFAVFLPGGWRRLALWPFLLLQLAIMVTGNYGFFNLLTLLLCLSLVTDDDWRRWVRPQWLTRLSVFPANRPVNRARRRFVTAFLIVVLAIGGLQTLQMTVPSLVPHKFSEGLAAIRPLMLVNRYGLFAVMTTTRHEIEVEGSQDGKEWRPYRFKYKPGPLERTPPWIIGHMPRLDWQMWFAALGSPNDQRWLRGFVACLLTGSEPVMALFDDVPFTSPPRFLRMQFYRYEFSDFETLRQRGLVWQRQFDRAYLPAVELRR